MMKKIILLKLFLFLIILQLHTSMYFAQKPVCNLKVQVFSYTESEYNLSKPFKNAKVSLVNSFNNKILLSENSSNVFIYKNLKEGEYNLVVKKDKNTITSKKLYLDCRFVDNNNFYNENMFLKENLSKPQESWQIRYDVAEIDDFPIALDGRKITKSSITSEQIALNERAVFFPSPNLPKNIENSLKERLKGLKTLVISVQIEIDENGDVVKATTDSSYLEISIYVLESAKKVRLLPLYFKGKKTKISGFINYVYSIDQNNVYKYTRL